jgi:hypothetical protein
MSYQAEISRASPTAILMVMDQSTSMNQRLDGGQSKAAFLADVLNKTLYTIITNCSKADGVRDYFHVGVVAYSGEAHNGFQGRLGDDALHAVSRLAEAPLRVETRSKKVAGLNGDVVAQSVRFPIWFEPRSQGKTSMCAGLTAAIDILDQWCVAHPSAFPPLVGTDSSLDVGDWNSRRCDCICGLPIGVAQLPMPLSAGCWVCLTSKTIEWGTVAKSLPRCCGEGLPYEWPSGSSADNA